MTVSFLVVLAGVLCIIVSAFARANEKSPRVSLWNLGWGLVLFALLVVGKLPLIVG